MPINVKYCSNIFVLPSKFTFYYDANEKQESGLLKIRKENLKNGNLVKTILQNLIAKKLVNLDWLMYVKPRSVSQECYSLSLPFNVLLSFQAILQLSFYLLWSVCCGCSIWKINGGVFFSKKNKRITSIWTAYQLSHQ